MPLALEAEKEDMCRKQCPDALGAVVSDDQGVSRMETLANG